MTVESISLTIAALLAWIALVHIIVGSGARLGELVWSGRQPRLLDPGLRVRSLAYASLLLASGLTLASTTHAIDWSPVPDRWVRSATFTVTAFMITALIYSLFWGSRWERMLFAPITLLAAGFAAWLTFG